MKLTSNDLKMMKVEQATMEIRSKLDIKEWHKLGMLASGMEQALAEDNTLRAAELRDEMKQIIDSTPRIRAYSKIAGQTIADIIWDIQPGPESLGLGLLAISAIILDNGTRLELSPGGMGRDTVILEIK